ncbi:targeting protein for Xklp2-B [Trichonephila clavata]|uniref:Targeting protein for Xklp2-B n=1 Tax=Trichonephila clavata TaxID=2740835 RepID=A0A8X6JJ61_TRICU|nr:targeting protein for Xklp2-B [Trichonephila clavata]
MNISDLDCPQYVCFDSEAFKKDLLGTSVLSTDSLEETENAQYNTENSTLTSEDLSDLTSNCEEEPDINDHQESSDLGTSHSMETEDCSYVSYNSNTNEKENFPINRAKLLPAKNKSSALKGTVPKPFRFETDGRIKKKPVDISNYDEKDFPSKLRQNSIKQTLTNQANRVTKVKPFNLTSTKRKHEEESEYVPLAEQVSSYHQKVPERYHTTSQKEFQPQEHWEPPPLKAKSPNLQAVKRRRVVTAVSREQQELEEIQKYKFHAQPVDPKVYKGLSEGKIKPKYQTISRNLLQKTALQCRRKKSEKKYKFRARPIPKEILNGPTGLKEKTAIKPTKPKAPAFTTEERLEKRKIMEQERREKEKELEQQKMELSKISKSAPIKAPSAPYTHRITEVQPFTFDKADKERFSQKEKRIQEEIENDSKPFVFRAQLMPAPKPSSLPAVPKKPPTQPEPFNFLLDSRSSRHNSFSVEENVPFKAQPATVLKKEPFVPEKPPKQSIEVEEFHLFTDKRASERLRLKQIKDTEEREKEKALQIQKALEEEHERLELKKLRAEIVHKANPVRQFKPVEIKPSSMPLTQPISPEFQTEKRLRTKE